MGRTREVARRTIHEGGSQPIKRSRTAQQTPVPVTSSDSDSEDSSTNTSSVSVTVSDSDSDSIQEVQSASASTGLTISDPAVFDCPNCTNPLTIPVYQCEDGHFSCESCHGKSGNKCPTCRKPIGDKRCSGMEQVLGSILTPCKNMDHGCVKNISYGKKLDHENSCRYTPIPCPCVGCEYVGVSKSFYEHYVEAHYDSCKFIKFNKVNVISVGEELQFLLEEKEKTIFFFHRIVEHVGSFVCVSTQSTASNLKFMYDITSGSGVRSINMKSFVEVMPKQFAIPAKENCLLITKNVYVGAGQEDVALRLQLVIRRRSHAQNA